jgi:hypothetical protein
MYQRSGPHLGDVLLHLSHEYDDIVQGNLQLQVEGRDNGAEIYITRNAERGIKFYRKDYGNQRIEQVKYSTVPLSEDEVRALICQFRSSPLISN